VLSDLSSDEPVIINRNSLAGLASLFLLLSSDGLLLLHLLLLLDGVTTDKSNHTIDSSDNNSNDKSHLEDILHLKFTVGLVDTHSGVEKWSGIGVELVSVKSGEAKTILALRKLGVETEGIGERVLLARLNGGVVTNSGVVFENIGSILVVVKTATDSSESERTLSVVLEAENDVRNSARLET